MASIRIRRAVIADADAIASVLREAFVEYAPAYTPGAFAATTPTRDAIRARWSEGPVWVAEPTATIVGTVSAVPEREGLYIRSIAIVPRARGQGIGNLLLEQVESFARENGYPRMFLSTTPFLLRAIRLYERFGFARSDEEPHDLCGTSLFTMVKFL